MSASVLDRVAEEIINSPLWNMGSLVLWHAGEPLWLGVDWYADAYQRLSRGRAELRMQFQSNGTLLDDDWIAFLKHTKSSIGLSIDGPEWLHDRHRKDRAGRGTFHKAMAGAELLRANGIPFTNIATITSDALDHPDELYDFFAGLRPAKLALNVEEAEGANATSSLYAPQLLARVERFFGRIAERNFTATTPLRIREVESIVGTLTMRPARRNTSQETELGRIVSVGVNGDIALFSPELLTTERADGSSAVAGNILESPFTDILDSAAVTEQSREIEAGVAKCRASCEYFDFCGGGSPANKFFEHGTFDIDETWFCRLSRQSMSRGVLRSIASAGTEDAQLASAAN